MEGVAAAALALSAAAAAAAAANVSTTMAPTYFPIPSGEGEAEDDGVTVHLKGHVFGGNGTSNGTGDGGDDDSGASPKYNAVQATLIGISAGLLSLVTIAGNLMVMISFKMDKQLQTISNYFLFSLAVADIIIGLISMPLFTQFTILQEWRLGAAVCDAWLSIDYLASNASVLNLLVISFDRYFSVTRPLTYR